MSRRYALAGAGSAVTLAVIHLVPTQHSHAAVATAAAGHDVVAPEHRTSATNGYDVPYSLADIAAYHGNVDIVDGEVVAVEPTRINASTALNPTSFPLIYSPVVVRVVRVYRGALHQGDVIRLRNLGGTVGDQTSGADTHLPADALIAGATITVFTVAARDVGDGVVARTPNFVFTHQGSTATEVTHHNPAGLAQTPVELTQLLSLLPARIS